MNSTNFAELSVKRAMTLANLNYFESKKKAITQELYLFTRYLIIIKNNIDIVSFHHKYVGLHFPISFATC